MMHEIQVILRSLAVNAPIMKDWGLSLSRPLYLSMKVEETGAFIKGLSERPVIISAGMPLKEVKKKIRNTNSEAIILRMPVKKLRDHERFSLLVQHLLDCSADAKVGAQVFFVGTFQDENLGDNTFEISISEFPEMLDDDVDVVPDAKDLSVVEEQIFSHKKCDLDCLALYAAAAFCYPKLKLQGRQEDYQKLLII